MAMVRFVFQNIRTTSEVRLKGAADGALFGMIPLPSFARNAYTTKMSRHIMLITLTRPATRIRANIDSIRSSCSPEQLRGRKKVE